MRVAVASSSLIAKPTIERLSTEHDVALLISTPDAPSGRGRTLAPNEFATYFASDIRLAKPETQDDLSRLLSEKKIDIAIAIAYGKLIKKSALETPSYGWINLHFSLLPKWRGAAPVQRAIMANEQEIGLTIFKLDEGMDTGPMFRQMTYQISKNSSSGDVLSDLAEVGSHEIVKVLADISQGRTPIAQPESGFSLAPKIDKTEARIDWNKSKQTVHNLVRALNPNPMAWTEIRNTRLTIVSSEIPHWEDRNESPGTIAVTPEGVFVHSSDGPLKLLQVIPAGKRLMNADDWARGMRFSDGERCQ